MKSNAAAALSLAIVIAIPAGRASADDLAVDLRLGLRAIDGVLMAEATIESLPGTEVRGDLSFLVNGKRRAEVPVVSDHPEAIEAVVGRADMPAEVCVILEGELMIGQEPNRGLVELACASHSPQVRRPGPLLGPRLKKVDLREARGRGEEGRRAP